MKTYEEVYESNLKILNQEDVDINSLPDPDAYAVRITDNGIICTADAPISINRMYLKYHNISLVAEEYKRYRKSPIFYFPKEVGGINTTRASVFADKIDYCLYDLKRFYEGNCNPKMMKAYSREKTNKFLKDMGSFEALIDWLGVKGSFVNEQYDVYDIEKGNGETLKEVPNKPYRKWEKTSYYDNLKALIHKHYKLSGLSI